MKIDIEGVELTLEPTDLDDFHPDELYQHQPLFAELRQLRSRLLDPATSAEALAEVLQSRNTASDEAPEMTSADESEPAENADNMFERVQVSTVY